MCSGHSVDDGSARNKAVWAYTDDNKSVDILPLDGTFAECGHCLVGSQTSGLPLELSEASWKMAHVFA